MTSGEAYGGVTRHSGGHSVLGEWVLMSLTLQSKQALQNLSGHNERIEWTVSKNGVLYVVQEAKLLWSHLIEPVLSECPLWQLATQSDN